MIICDFLRICGNGSNGKLIFSEDLENGKNGFVHSFAKQSTWARLIFG